jgi:hypothetical protein
VSRVTSSTDVPSLAHPSAITISVRRAGTSLTARTTLTYPGLVLTGQAHRMDDNRVAAVAQATLAALPGHAGTQVESAQVVAVPGRKVALTVLGFPGGQGGYEAFVGSALVRDEVEDALARSVLDAVTARIETEEHV